MGTQNDCGADLEARGDFSARLGDTTYSAIQSAVYFLNRQSGIERPEELKGGISLYYKGSNRKGRNMKQDLGIEIPE